MVACPHLSLLWPMAEVPNPLTLRADCGTVGTVLVPTCPRSRAGGGGWETTLGCKSWGSAAQRPGGGWQPGLPPPHTHTPHTPPPQHRGILAAQNSPE